MKTRGLEKIKNTSDGRPMAYYASGSPKFITKEDAKKGRAHLAKAKKKTKPKKKTTAKKKAAPKKKTAAKKKAAPKKKKKVAATKRRKAATSKKTPKPKRRKSSTSTPNCLAGLCR